MSDEPPHMCASMSYVLGSPSYRVAYDDQFREYAMSAPGDSLEEMAFAFCPFCGTRLPDSVRRQWFDYFWERDLNPREDPVPQAMQTGRWWREAGL